MKNSELRHELATQFPAINTLGSPYGSRLLEAIKFVNISEGEITYEPGWECDAFLMCVSGGTRVFKSSESGREILLYRVEPGSTCVLTTSCLLANRPFPAASVAETDTYIAALNVATFQDLITESTEFRRFVFDNYAEVLADLIALIGEVTFSSIDMRLARHIIRSANADGIVQITHQQLAHDLGTVREVVSRHIGEWERTGLISVQRGKLRILDSPALQQYAD